MTVQLIQFCPSLQLLQSFFQNIALKGYSTQRWMAIDTEMNGWQFYRKTFLRSVVPKQPKNVEFWLWSIIETFPTGGAWLFRAGANILRGGGKRSQGRCATPHTSPPNPVMPYSYMGQCLPVWCKCTTILFCFPQQTNYIKWNERYVTRNIQNGKWHTRVAFQCSQTDIVQRKLCMELFARSDVCNGQLTVCTVGCLQWTVVVNEIRTTWKKY
jgi:hypothetical protein